MKTQNQPSIIFNPLNGKFINMMPFFEYMQEIQEVYSVNGASCPSHIAEVVDGILQGPSQLMNNAMDLLDYDYKITVGGLRTYSEAVSDANRLMKVFRNMKLSSETIIEPPLPTKSNSAKGFVIPNTNEKLQIEPFIEFIERYGSDSVTSIDDTANVIENAANVTDEENPDSDLTNSTDLLRALAKCLRDMKVK